MKSTFAPRNRRCPTGLLACLAVLLFAFTSVLHADPGVKDDGQFFKPATVEKVNAEIKQIKADYGKELVIETFPGITEGLRDEWDAAKNDSKKRSQFFAKWIGERAHLLQVNGVYILICKNPGHLEVEAGQKTKQKAFTEANRNRMRDILIEAFNAKNDDEGLIKGVAYFREALKENLGGTHPATPVAAGDEQFKHSNSGSSSGSPFPNRTQSTGSPSSPVSTTSSKGFSIMGIILIVIAAIVIFRIIASLTGGSRNSGGPGYGSGQSGGPGYGAGYGGGGYGGGGGGGGFFRNMFGGLLGGAAGSYLYDKYRDSNNPAHNPQNPSTGGYAGNQSDNSSGGDFGSQSSSDDNDRGQGFGGGGSGGDFGSSGSDAGSNFSSSDSSGSSGGDFGGSSDSGSSGGDSGGGGGDF